VSEPGNWLDGCWGDAAAAQRVALPEAAQRRVDRFARREGTLKNAVRLDDAALAIAGALRCGDQDGAREMIQAGAQLFGSQALVLAVGQASQELEAAALQAEQEAAARQDDRRPLNGHDDAETYDDLEQSWDNVEPR
jgi:hypothetical protein